ncbi:MAG TPA: protein-export chaperone SecB [Pseudomonadales bacterium]|nr:protein-export chaperone SecB [Pseudomonadales bacterium]
MSEQEQQFGIQRIYIKDVSFESPQGAAVFGKTWKPAIQQEISTTTTAMNDDRYEVVLTITITGKLDDQPAFLVEVQQAGVFLMKGLTEEQIRQVAGANCPTILFPYAREVIDSLLARGTLPPLMLPPINFDALFQQAIAQQGDQAGTTAH